MQPNTSLGDSPRRRRRPCLGRVPDLPIRDQDPADGLAKDGQQERCLHQGRRQGRGQTSQAGELRRRYAGLGCQGLELGLGREEGGRGEEEEETEVQVGAGYLPLQYDGCRGSELLEDRLRIDLKILNIPGQGMNDRTGFGRRSHDDELRQLAHWPCHREALGIA